MKNFKPLTVLVIESSLLLIDQLKPGYTQIFEISGYNPVFFGATSEKDARDVIDREWPHIIICDMTLSQGGADGLIIVQHLKQDYPDIFLILASKQAYSIRSVFAKKAFFDMFFDKTEINAGNRTYFDIYSQQLRERFQVNTYIDIDDDASGYKKDFKASELREFNSLLAQITFTGHDSDAMITPDTARIDKLTGGFSGSKVYRFTTFNRSSKLESVTAVLKVSTRFYAQTELQNYNKFVKWGLPYTWRVDVLGCGFTKKYGAIAYSFVHGDVGSKINSLSNILKISEEGW
jgi:CheY-like chemotaxis protein